MTRRIRRFAVVGVLVLAAATTAAAQRSGMGRFFAAFLPNVQYDGRLTFVRMSYPPTGRGNQGSYPAWSHDYPLGEQHFMSILTTVSNVSAHPDGSNIMTFSDPEMFKHPILYLCEPGFWTMADDEVVALRSYLTKGGFLIVDDFHSYDWGNFDEVMSRVFPAGKWQDLDITHPIFHSFFEIDNIDMPPPLAALGDRTIYRALFQDNDPNGRMMVIANYQNDISEYWEFSGTGRWAVDETNEAYKIGVNEFIYGLTH